jgi:two-component system, chemotaxis family, sensor kinase CheA
VEAMRGRVSISTVPGRGTTFKMVLPLTLAIIEGMLVAVGSERYIIPTLSVIESMVLQKNMYFSFAGQNELINVRGEILPLVRLSAMFDVKDAKTDLSQGLVVIVEGVGTRFGIFIDDVVTQQQVVIKSLGSGVETTKLVAGAAILSDGRVGLILNVDEMGSSLTRDGTRSVSKAQASQVGESMSTTVLREDMETQPSAQ